MSIIYITEKSQLLLSEIVKRKGISKAKFLETMLLIYAKNMNIHLDDSEETDDAHVTDCSETLTIRMSQEEKEKLKMRADKACVFLSDLVRKGLKLVLGEEVKQEREGLEVEQKEDIKRGMARVSLSLSNRENKTLVKIMEKTGLKRSQAFLSIFRAFHFNEPQFCAGEVGQLNLIKSQLQAIGRNLNQITRKINTSLQDSDLMNAERVHDLSCALNSCVEPLSARMKSYRERWTVIL